MNDLQLTPDGRLRHLLTLDGLPRPTDAYAVGATEVLVVPAARLREVIARAEEAPLPETKREAAE